jgi:RNA polymerase sigma-70 factor (sigma-E family)
MTSPGNDTAGTREDECLVRAYQQTTGAQAAWYVAAYDVAAGLARFTGWLQNPAAAGPELDADQMAAGLCSVPELDADQAVVRLYVLHYLWLVRLGALLVRDIATAEEVVQDSFVAMHGAWPKLRDADKAVAYLRQAVVNRSRSVLRHRAVIDKNLQETPPDASAAGRPEQPAVRAVLRDLPAQQHEAIVLRYYAGLSEDQVAATMGISHDAVKAHTTHGLSALSAALDRASPHPARPPDCDDAGPCREER